VSRLVFARQSLLILVASHVGSVCLVVMAGLVARALDPVGSSTTHYSLFETLRAALAQCSIPLLGMQTAFAQLAAKRAAQEIQPSLAGAIRGVVKASLLLWTGLAAVCFLFRDWIALNYSLPNLSILGFALVAGWAMVTTPLFLGLLQGRQRFVHFSVAKILSDISLLLGVILAVVLWKRDVTAAMAGLCAGSILGCGIALGFTRADWSEKPEPFDLIRFAKGLLPLTLGLGIATFMLTEDQFIIRRFFESSANDYMTCRKVGTIAYFLMLPMTYVLFPKVVASLARAEANTALLPAIGATALVSGTAALFLSLFPELPLRLLYGDKYVHAAPLVPPFAWAFVPLALFTILINNLLARERYQVVPFLVATAAAYSITLRFYHPSVSQVIVVLGIFSTLLFGVTAWFTWKD
jgi:O-antigen/teichoic acid export membrane protein